MHDMFLHLMTLVSHGFHMLFSTGDDGGGDGLGLGL